MVDDTCVFCWEILTKPTDRNLVEGKGNWSAELNDLSFVILSTSSYICKQCLTLVKRKTLKENLRQLNEELTTLYQQKCSQRSLTFKRRHPKRLTFQSAANNDNNETIVSDDTCPNTPATILVENAEGKVDSCQFNQ